MREIVAISEDEMVLAFLQAEFNSVRFQSTIQEILQKRGFNSQLIQAPDLQNEQENIFRRKVLGDYRGYQKNDNFFKGFPNDVKWMRLALTRAELAQVRYIDYDYWVELSGGSRLAIDGAKNALAGVDIFGVSSQNYIAIAEAFKQGAQFPTVILIGRGPDHYLVVLEGHVRLTACLIALEYLPAELEVIVGFSEKIIEWGCY